MTTIARVPDRAAAAFGDAENTVDSAADGWARLRERASRPLEAALQYLALAVILAALGLSGLWNLFSLLPEPPSPWLTLITAVPACAIVLVKRRAPGPGLCLAIAVFIVDLLTFGGLVPLLAMLELIHARLVTLDAEHRRRVLTGVILGTALVALGALARSGDVRTAVMIGLQLGALLGVSYWYGTSTAQSHELVSLYRQRAENAERLALLDREAAVRDERDRMARELHDVVAGHIAAVAIRSEAALAGAGRDAAEGSQGAADPEDSGERRALRAVRDSSLEAHAALRSMIGVLRSGEGFELPPGRSGLAGLVAAASGSGVQAAIVDGVAGELAAPIDHAVGHIVREALANAVRHAAGAEVEVSLSDEGGSVLVEVVSRGGRGSSRPELPGNGMGLQLLAERVRALGGVFAAGPDADGAWAVRASLPREVQESAG